LEGNKNIEVRGKVRGNSEEHGSKQTQHINGPDLNIKRGNRMGVIGGVLEKEISK